MAQRLSRSAVTAAREVRVVISRLRRQLQELGLAEDLSPSQTAVLTRLSKEGPTSASMLAAAERVSPQAIAATLTVFDAHGLIERSPDPGDGRRQIISLTPAGAARAEDTALAKEEWLARALQDQFTEDERRIVVQAMSILDRLTQSR